MGEQETIERLIHEVESILETLKSMLDKPETSDPGQAFERFRVKYPGVKRGFQIEYEYFKAKNKDWKTVVFELEKHVNRQIRQRQQKKDLLQFVPTWQNLKTYLGNRSWEETYSTGI
jgi:hypothetical protein